MERWGKEGKLMVGTQEGPWQDALDRVCTVCLKKQRKGKSNRKNGGNNAADDDNTMEQYRHTD